MDLNNFNALPKEQMKNTKGGMWPFGKRTVEYYDVDGDGRDDKVITKYDKAGNVKVTKVIYG